MKSDNFRAKTYKIRVFFLLNRFLFGEANAKPSFQSSKTFVPSPIGIGSEISSIFFAARQATVVGVTKKIVIISMFLQTCTLVQGDHSQYESNFFSASFIQTRKRDFFSTLSCAMYLAPCNLMKMN